MSLEGSDSRIIAIDFAAHHGNAEAEASALDPAHLTHEHYLALPEITELRERGWSERELKLRAERMRHAYLADTLDQRIDLALQNDMVDIPVGTKYSIYRGRLSETRIAFFGTSDAVARLKRAEAEGRIILPTERKSI